MERDRETYISCPALMTKKELCLIFYEVAYNMLSLLTVGFERYMNPKGFRRLGGALLDELVILEMLHHPCEPLHACGGIGDADVGGLACHVLRV